MKFNRVFLAVGLAALVATALFLNSNRIPKFNAKWGWEQSVGTSIEQYKRGNIQAYELEQIVSEQFKALGSNQTERNDFVVFVCKEWLSQDTTAAGPAVATVELFERQPDHVRFAEALDAEAGSHGISDSMKKRLHGFADEIRH